MARVQKHATAKRDLVGHFVYLAENAGLETAERFLRQAERSFSELGRHPGLGVHVALSRPALAGMRTVILSPVFWGEGSAFGDFKHRQILRRLLAPQNDAMLGVFPQPLKPGATSEIRAAAGNESH